MKVSCKAKTDIPNKIKMIAFELSVLEFIVNKLKHYVKK